MNLNWHSVGLTKFQLAPLNTLENRCQVRLTLTLARLWFSPNLHRLAKVGSFVGYFPADEPRYTIAVVMRTKKHARRYYGGSIAAPVFRMIADRIFAAGKGWAVPSDSLDNKDAKVMVAQKAPSAAYEVLLGAVGKYLPLPAENTMQVVAADSSNRLIAEQQPVYKGVVPDVSGMSLKDAVYLLEKEGLLIHINGKGKVRAQSVAPGTIARRGQEIRLDLRS